MFSVHEHLSLQSVLTDNQLFPPSDSVCRPDVLWTLSGGGAAVEGSLYWFKRRDVMPHSNRNQNKWKSLPPKVPFHLPGKLIGILAKKNVTHTHVPPADQTH